MNILRGFELIESMKITFQHMRENSANCFKVIFDV